MVCAGDDDIILAREVPYVRMELCQNEHFFQEKKLIKFVIENLGF